MCQEKCPVKINTGDLIKHIRAEEMKQAPRASATAMWLADNFSLLNTSVPKFLNLVNMFHSVLGPTPLKYISSWLNQVRVHAVWVVGHQRQAYTLHHFLCAVSSQKKGSRQLRIECSQNMSAFVKNLDLIYPLSPGCRLLTMSSPPGTHTCPREQRRSRVGSRPHHNLLHTASTPLATVPMGLSQGLS
jgi:hypothetical protein